MSENKRPRIFGDILPYEAEVAEPNGPRIAAWVLADYADRANVIFHKWLAEHDAEVVAQVLRNAAESLGENQMIREGDVKEWLLNYPWNSRLNSTVQSVHIHLNYEGNQICQQSLKD